MWTGNGSTGDGVGGFLDSTYAGESETIESKPGSVRISSILPVMIEHVLQNPGGAIQLWGKEITIVQFIGYVQNFERVTTRISYDLVDETGKISAFQFLEAGDNKAITEVPIGSYARVVGCPREQSGKAHVLILKIMPVVSMTELLTHLMEVTYLCLKSKELFCETDASEPMIAKSSAMDDEMSLHGMNADQVHVFKVIKAENHTETGIVKQELIKKLSPDLRNKLEGILEFLVGEGHIYTTCTDDHFKAT